MISLNSEIVENIEDILQLRIKDRIQA
jgi:hypothetical protein